MKVEAKRKQSNAFSLLMSLDTIKIHILNGEITWDLVGQAVSELMQTSLASPNIKRFIIPVLSTGGDTDAAWSLYTTLKNIDAEIITLAVGRVYSAALLPYMAGHKRLAFKESVFLFHPTTITNMHNEEKAIYKMKEDIAGDKLDRAIFKNLLKTACPNAPKKAIANLVHESKSFFVDADKAKKYGLVTHLLDNINQLEDLDTYIPTDMECSDRAQVVNPQKLITR
jgi:ATP-dependent protease ClpP protease subunit